MLFNERRNPRADPLALGDAHPRLIPGSPRRLSLLTHDPTHTHAHTHIMHKSDIRIAHTQPLIPHNPTFTLFSSYLNPRAFIYSFSFSSLALTLSHLLCNVNLRYSPRSILYRLNTLPHCQDEHTLVDSVKNKSLLSF